MVEEIYRKARDAQLLATIPGIGVTLATLISIEIDGVDRFLGGCLLYHVQAELPQLCHLRHWGQLKVNQITDELLNTLFVIARGRIPAGKCSICQ